MVRIRSDPTLLAEVRKYGKFDTNACFQCGSCTVICNLSNNSASFPRRMVQYALMGLRSPLRSCLEPWLCYYCGDCSTTCPRQSEPGEAMMTLRRYLTAQYDWTGLSAKIYRSKAWEIGALTIVATIVLLLVVLYHLQVVGLQLSEFIAEALGMEHMFDTITTFTLVVFFIPIFVLISHAFRMYWFTMHRGRQVKIPLLLYFTEFRTFILHAVTQMRFRDCPDRSRWIKHGVLVAGCLLMFILLIFFLQWFQTDNIYPIYHPQRWLGYLATVALVYTTVDILISRLRKREQIHKFSELSDWTFPILLLLTAVSGIAVHIFKYSGLELTTHYTYALHLAIAVPMLVIEIPFGKWSHMIYRPLAIYFQTVKEKAMQQEAIKELIEEPVLEHVE